MRPRPWSKYWQRAAGLAAHAMSAPAHCGPDCCILKTACRDAIVDGAGSIARGVSHD
jgi:hypothetical protein